MRSDNMAEKTENKKKIDLKKVLKKIKENKLLLGIIGGVVLILIIILIVASLSSKDEKDKDKNKESENKVISNEQTVEEEYGFSNEDAINAVKPRYNSDNYEFEATTREDNMYIVTVKNIDTESITKYVVDPNNGAVSLLTE